MNMVAFRYSGRTKSLRNMSTGTKTTICPGYNVVATSRTREGKPTKTAKEMKEFLERFPKKYTEIMWIEEYEEMRALEGRPIERGGNDNIPTSDQYFTPAQKVILGLELDVNEEVIERGSSENPRMIAQLTVDKEKEKGNSDAPTPPKIKSGKKTKLEATVSKLIDKKE